MAFLFTIVGLLMIVTGVKGTYAQFGAQIAGDFTGSQPFTYWVAAILGIGSLGYIDALRTVSRLFLALILISMVLANGGFFTKLTAALKQGPVAPQGGSGAPASGDSIGSQIGTALGNIIKGSLGSGTAPTTGLFGKNDPTPNDPRTAVNLGPLGTINNPSTWFGGK
jgi:hypothetical protein